MQEHSINRQKIDWNVFRTSVMTAAGAAQSVEQTFPAIRTALEMLGDGHSLLPAGDGHLHHCGSSLCRAERRHTDATRDSGVRASRFLQWKRRRSDRLRERRAGRHRQCRPRRPGRLDRRRAWQWRRQHVADARRCRSGARRWPRRLFHRSARSRHRVGGPGTAGPGSAGCCSRASTHPTACVGNRRGSPSSSTAEPPVPGKRSRSPFSGAPRRVRSVRPPAV